MKMRSLRFALIFFVVFVSFRMSGAHADPMCGVLLSSPHENVYEKSHLDETDHFIAYLKELLGQGVITDSQFSHFVLGLRQGATLNPFQDEYGSASEIQRDGIQGYLDHPALDKDRLLEWAEQELMVRGRIRVKRKGTREETQDAFYQRLVLSPVRAGRFSMDHREVTYDHAVRKVHSFEEPVILTYPIEVMSTPVTQKHWVDLMGENPARLNGGPDSIVIEMNGNSIRMQPNHPVENVTWWSALVFANRLSEKHGLKPAYDLSGMIWKGRAEGGSLKPESGEIMIYANGGIHDPYDGDIYYQAEGYRLPTEAEQGYLRRALGAAHGQFYFGDNENELKDHAWYKDNSEGTHPVGELKPLILDGEMFYDLLGNVWEWCWDWYQPRFKGGRNPIGLKKKYYNFFHVISGGNWYSPASQLSSFRRATTTTSRGDIGFRLVRTMRDP